MAKFMVFAGLLVLTAGAFDQAEAASFPKWPVKNGDFSVSLGWGRPAEWAPRTETGKHLFKMELPPKGAINTPSAAVIETQEIGRGYYSQTIPLMKGDYRLSVEISGADDAKAEVVFTGGKKASIRKAVEVKGGWQMVELDLSTADEEDGRAGIYLYSTGGGTVKFRNVKIETRRLCSSSVPLEGGGRIGGVVLPGHPTVAERFACYELERWIYQMTGLAVGLKGRDQIVDGTLIYIGGTIKGAPHEKLKGRPPDSYVAGMDGENMVLTGNTAEGTLYAVYDFLKQQGCRWVIPGADGEVVPKRQKLVCGRATVQAPDYEIRGFCDVWPDFFLDAGWIGTNSDDYFDWALRNRMNAVWLLYGTTSDLGEHRGHGWVQMMNHSYNSVIAPGDRYFKDHPDWYPLVKGKRTPIHSPTGWPSQLCVSNKGLRDYTVQLARDYFREHPEAKVFAMNPMDGPVYWCECDQCKVLDPPGADWSKNGAEELFMTDRALNYANYVADQLSKMCPGKMVSMYAYGCTREPPVKEKVHPNVLIHYATWQGPLNKPFLDPEESFHGWPGVRKQLDGWRKAGGRDFTHYNYLDWEHQNVPIFWFYKITELLKGLKGQYHFRGLLGETESMIQSSPVFYSVMANALWNTQANYTAVIRDTCNRFYGAAAEEMCAYHLGMDQEIMASDMWEKENWNPCDQKELSMEALEKGRTLLEKAAAKIKGDAVLERRIALAQFAHANLTLVRALNEEKKSEETYRQGRQAFDDARNLSATHNIMMKQATQAMLRKFYFPPIVDTASTVLALPVQWKFRIDPSDVGLKEGWFNKGTDPAWKNIRTDKTWTDQGYSDYHGVAWYQLDFTLPATVSPGTSLSLYFGAIDGDADIFLDGAKIGEQKKDVGFMWDKAFAIALPATLDPTQAHHLAIRVRKEHFGAGIWKPVTIVKAAMPK